MPRVKKSFQLSGLPHPYASDRELQLLSLRTLGNLFTLYRPLLDTLHFFDNSSATPRLIFKDEASQATINDASLYERLRQEFAP